MDRELGGDRERRRDHELRERFVHLRQLNSAWGVLAAFEVSAGAPHIPEAGRAVNTELTALAALDFEDRDRSGLPKVDKLLQGIESEMRAMAFEVPVPELRATLSTQVSSDRRGILDLLDLMLATELEGHEGWAGRVSALDYLITLLCTGSPRGTGAFGAIP